MKTTEKTYRKFIRIPSDDGKRHRVAVTAKSERELEIKYREKIIELARTNHRYAESVTVENYFPHYMETYVRPHLRDKAYTDKKARLQRYFVLPYADVELTNITAPMLQKLLNDQKGKSKSFLSKLKSEITAIFDVADDEGLLRRNPCRRLVIPAAEERSRRALTAEERQAFLKAADRQKHGLLFLIIYYCGLRPGEVRALTYNDIDLEKRTIQVNKALEESTGKIKPPKTRSGIRTVPIPDELLRRLPKKNGAELIFRGDRSKKALSASNYKRAWQSILNYMDIEMGAKTYRNKILTDTSVLDRSLTPYYLRHNYCSMLAEKSVDIKTAQYFMGHSSINVTANIYQHVTDQMFESGANKIRNL